MDVVHHLGIHFSVLEMRSQLADGLLHVGKHLSGTLFIQIGLFPVRRIFCDPLSVFLIQLKDLHTVHQSGREIRSLLICGELSVGE